jgi:hypothetical protein
MEVWSPEILKTNFRIRFSVKTIYLRISSECELYSVHFTSGFVEWGKRWLIYAFPILQYLIFICCNIQQTFNKF